MINEMPKDFSLPVVGINEKQEVKLLVGSFDMDGDFYDKVLCGPLTGIIRKEFTKTNILNNSGKLITSVLSEILEFPHKPNMNKEDKKFVVRGMYSADRAWCIFAIRNATTANPIAVKQECSCEEIIEIYTKPDELKYYKIEDTEYKLDKEKKDYIFKYKTTWGEEAIFYLARGINEEEIGSINKNIVESVHAILASCLKYLNGKPVDPTIFDIWPTGKTDELFGVLLENQPGPETLMNIKCPSCNRIIEYGVDPADFLLPNARRRQFRKSGNK